MLNALPYITLVLFFAGLAWLRHWIKDAEKGLLIDLLSILAFAWFFGFRGFVMYDWTVYYPNFMCMPDLHVLLSVPVLKWVWEPGFTLLALLCKTIYPSFTLFVFITCCLNTFLLVRFLKRYHVNLPLGLMIYLATSGIMLSTDLMRNSLALLLFVNAIPYLVQRRPWPYFLLCTLCFTFHSSSLFFFPLYFFLHRQFSKKVLLIFFLVSNVIYLAQIPFVKSVALTIADFVLPSTKLWIEAYLKMDKLPSLLSIGYLERLLSGVLLFAYIDKLRAIRPENNVFINSMVLYLCLFLCLSEFRTISLRCSMLFSFSYWVLWLDFIRCFSFRNNRYLFICFLIIYSVAKTYGNCHSALCTYYNVLFTEHPYSERLVNFRRHFNDE